MTSLLKTPSVIEKKQYMRYVGGPYYNYEGTNTLFPFTFKNGTLDINPINGFDLDTVGTPKNGNDGCQVTLHGGLNLVQNIGNNFRTYIYNTNWGSATASVTASVTDRESIKVVQPGVVTRVQQLDNSDTGNLPASINPPTDSYVISETAPIETLSKNTPTFGVTYAFYKPLIISAKFAEGIRYITFFSSWDN